MQTELYLENLIIGEGEIDASGAIVNFTNATIDFSGAIINNLTNLLLCLYPKEKELFVIIAKSKNCLHC